MAEESTTNPETPEASLPSPDEVISGLSNEDASDEEEGSKYDGGAIPRP